MLLTLVYQFIFQLTSFLDLKSFSVRNNRQNKFSKLYRKLRWLLPYNTTVVELLAFICSYKYLLFLQRCMLFCTQRAEPSFIRSPNFWTSKSCSLSSNWFFESEPPFIDKTDGLNWARYTKRTAIRQQHASNMPRMLNKDLTRVMQSLSRIRQNRASERKAKITRAALNCTQELTASRKITHLNYHALKIF